MPSPLSGLTQRGRVADQRPVGAGDVGDRAAHRQQRRGGHPQVAGELELLAALRRRSSCISGLIAMFGGSLRGRQGADADVHLAGAEREDPAVAGEDLAVLAAQLEVGADPRVVGHARSRRRSGRRRRRRCRGATRGPAPCPAASGRRRPRPAAGRRSRRSRRPAVKTTAATRSPSLRTSTARAPSTASAPALIATVRRWSSSSVRATAEPQAGRRAARPRQQQRLAEAVRPQPVVDGVGAQPVARGPSRCSSPIARGVSPSPHVLSRGKTAASTSTTSSPARALHAAAADPAGPAPTTRTSVAVGVVTRRFSPRGPNGDETAARGPVGEPRPDIVVPHA